MVKQIKQDIMKTIKPFARGSFPEGSKRQHHFSFCFVILNMAWAWSDSTETCPIHLRAETGTAGRNLPWLIQQGTRSTTASCTAPAAVPACSASTRSACQPRFVWKSWACSNKHLTLVFFPGAAASWIGRCIQSVVSALVPTTSVRYVSPARTAVPSAGWGKGPRLSWAGLEATPQQGKSPHCCVCWVISEQFRCYCSTSLCFSIRFIIWCQSCFAVSFLFCAQATCEQALVLSACITEIYINSQQYW